VKVQNGHIYRWQRVKNRLSKLNSRSGLSWRRSQNPGEGTRSRACARARDLGLVSGGNNYRKVGHQLGNLICNNQTKGSVFAECLACSGIERTACRIGACRRQSRNSLVGYRLAIGINQNSIAV
jgi:hypothetical protein